MDWFLLSIATAISLGLVTALDKRLLDAHFENGRTFIFLVGTLWLCLGILLLPTGMLIWGVPDLGYSFIACLAGALLGLGLAFYFWGLTFEEASRGTPIFSTSALFAAVLAMWFLSEELTGIQWAGMVGIVLSIGLLSYRPTPNRNRSIGWKSIGVFLSGALFAGGALVLTKQASSGLSIWELYACHALGSGFALGLSGFHTRQMSQVARVFRNGATVRLFLFAELGLAGVTILFMQAAIKLGPVSLVGAIIATRSLWVLVFSTLFSTRRWNLLNEPLDRQTLGLKIVSTIIIVIGLATLTLY